MPFINANELREGQNIESDICIIGAGAAGLTIAHEFFNNHMRVAILESGGLEFDEKTQSLYEGRIVGRPHIALDVGRLRYFGGTTNHWSGNVKPLDPIDFEDRNGIPGSGWPFGMTELLPYYDRAQRFLGLPDRSFVVKTWENQLESSRWPFDQERIQTQVVQKVSESKMRFGETFRDFISKSENIFTYLFANVLEIEVTNEPHRVQ